MFSYSWSCSSIFLLHYFEAYRRLSFERGREFVLFCVIFMSSCSENIFYRSVKLPKGKDELCFILNAALPWDKCFRTFQVRPRKTRNPHNVESDLM